MAQLIRSTRTGSPHTNLRCFDDRPAIDFIVRDAGARVVYALAGEIQTMSGYLECPLPVILTIQLVESEVCADDRRLAAHQMPAEPQPTTYYKYFRDCKSRRGNWV